MPKRIEFRTLTSEEEQEIRRLAKSRKEPLRIVQRARVIVIMLDNPGLAPLRVRENEPASKELRWASSGSSDSMS